MMSQRTSHEVRCAFAKQATLITNPKNFILILFTMSTAQLTSQILQQVSLITEDEGKLQRALKALKRITTPKPDPTEMTYDEFVNMVRKAEKGSLTEMLPDEDLTTFLRRQGYAL